MAKPTEKTPEKSPSRVAALAAKLVPIDSIRPDPKNAREHNERSIDSIAASLKGFGQQKPIVIDRENVIRAGSGTWLGAKRLGWTEINVVVSDLDAENLKRYAIADNRLNELSYFDDASLAEQLANIEAGDLIALGFDSAELADIFDTQRAPGDDNEKGPTHSMMGNGGQISVRMLVAVSNVELVERAMHLTGEINRETALLAVCKAYCDATKPLDIG